MTRADIEKDPVSHIEDVYVHVSVIAERQVDHGHKLDALKATQGAIRETQIDHHKRFQRIESKVDKIESKIDKQGALLEEVLRRLPTPEDQ